MLIRLKTQTQTTKTANPLKMFVEDRKFVAVWNNRDDRNFENLDKIMKKATQLPIDYYF